MERKKGGGENRERDGKTTSQSGEETPKGNLRRAEDREKCRELVPTCWDAFTVVPTTRW